MLSKIKAYIDRHQLLDDDKRYLVALSGGADSVCLLLAMQHLGYQTEAVHCNFHLRGEESTRDEEFVKRLCDSNHVRLHLIHFDTKTYASIHHVSIEMAARELRYRYFEQLRQDIGAEGICVAHHEDDSVETILMNLLRGTGIHGLTGIKPRNGHILRPLLCVSRQEIETWLAQHGQAYVTDSSNLEANVVRNKLRLDIIPRLGDVMPGATANILQTAAYLREAADVYDHAVEAALHRLIREDSIEICQLTQEPSAESLLFEWLKPLGFTPATITQIAGSIATAGAGSIWTSDSHELTISQGRLVVMEKEAERPTLCIPETGLYAYDGQTKFRFGIEDGTDIVRQADHACLDAAKTPFPLTIRPVRQGDRFQPFGMKGTRLVSDFLTDRHLSVLDKRRQLVLTTSDDRIVWLIGHRPDHRFCITKDTTQMLHVAIIRS